jgi:hypothetical protein
MLPQGEACKQASGVVRARRTPFPSIRFGQPVTTLYRSVLTFIAVLFATLMVVSYVPSISTWLPSKIASSDTDWEP